MTDPFANDWNRTPDVRPHEGDGAGVPTHRPVNPGAEKHLGVYYPVLDHGFLALRDYMGTDQSIDMAARCSYGAGTRRVNEIAGLIDYLVRNQHTSPIEMPEALWHARMPIFVARQWVRHRMASLNEYSGRYSKMLDIYYVPQSRRLGKQSEDSKQGTSAEPLSDAQKTRALEILERDAAKCREGYNELLDMDLSRELARIGLGVNVYTEWYWKSDLKNTLHFVHLRNDAHAQWEIAAYARIMQAILHDMFPCLMKSYREHLEDGLRLSATEVEILRLGLAGKVEDAARLAAKMSGRQWRTETNRKLTRLNAELAGQLDAARAKLAGKKKKTKDE
ncbi:MAG: FAD-dependent thymidylate synthase [Planctomycetota bacterium]